MWLNNILVAIHSFQQENMLFWIIILFAAEVLSQGKRAILHNTNVVIYYNNS